MQQTKYFYPRFFKSLGYLLIALAATALCAFMSVALVTEGEGASLLFLLITIPGAFFFALGILWFGHLLYKRVAKIPLLAMDQTGLVDSTDLLEYGKHIRWNEVKDARIITMTAQTSKHRNTQKFICLKLRNPDAIAINRSKWRRYFLQVNKNLMGAEYVYITTAFLKAKPEQVLDAIHELSGGVINLVSPSKVKVTANPRNITNLLVSETGNIEHTSKSSIKTK